jgi:hypothetical protein
MDPAEAKAYGIIDDIFASRSAAERNAEFIGGGEPTRLAEAQQPDGSAAEMKPEG